MMLLEPTIDDYTSVLYEYSQFAAKGLYSALFVITSAYLVAVAIRVFYLLTKDV